MATGTCCSWPRMALAAMVLLCVWPANPAEAKERFCGKKLVDTLSMLCSSFPTLPPPDYNKRNKNDNEFDFTDGSKSWTTHINWPGKVHRIHAVGRFLQPDTSVVIPQQQDAEDYGEFPEFVAHRFRLVKRGVSDECCKNPCTEATLMTFCG